MSDQDEHDDTCPDCHGSGGKMMGCTGDDEREDRYALECHRCGGSGFIGGGEGDE